MIEYKCTPNCRYFSCDSDSTSLFKPENGSRCSCDKYDIWVEFMDDCKDGDDHFTPVHDDFSRNVLEEANKKLSKLSEKGYVTPGEILEATKPIRTGYDAADNYWDSYFVDHTAKHDEGKLQIHLVPPQIIRDIAEVRMYGNKKYGDPDNWKTVEKWRYVDALLRHLLLYLEDPDGVDEESGIKHYKHAACNMAFICAMEEEEK